MNIKCSSQCTLFPLPTRGMEEVEVASREQEEISGKKDRENKVTQKMFRAVRTEERSSSPAGGGLLLFWWKNKQEYGIVIKL